MRRWTVILIPHDRGQRRSFTLSDLHLWSSIAAIALLASLSAIFYFRQSDYENELRYLSQQYRELEVSIESQGLPANLDEQLAQREAQIRAEYEARDSAITNELGRLYDLEKQVRAVTQLPARTEISADLDTPAAANADGKGGPPDASIEGIRFDDSLISPPEMIQGLAQPSADLMLEEMRLRLASLHELIEDANTQRDMRARTPKSWPTAAAKRRINSKFGTRRDPISNNWKHHGGVDISADYGSSVLSTADGVVTFSGYDQFLGNLVQIDHGYGTETWYGHLSKRVVKKGDAVVRGMVVGKVGSTGRSTGPHIHYEVHVDGKRVDPRNFMGL
jgi:murein DD-endopeptidase MepM/ murein hydrolase activator NlpD